MALFVYNMINNSARLCPGYEPQLVSAHIGPLWLFLGRGQDLFGKPPGQDEKERERESLQLHAWGSFKLTSLTALLWDWNGFDVQPALPEKHHHVPRRLKLIKGPRFHGDEVHNEPELPLRRKK